jgi:hypothetical protein
MTQVQNPNRLEALVSQLSPNVQGLDIIQILAPGGSIAYRLNQFQTIVYSGVGPPIVVIGVLAGNIYVDVTSGNWWIYNGSSWTQISSGGGGGGSNLASHPVSGSIDGVNVTFTLAGFPPGILLLYLDGLFQNQSAGGDYTLSGQTITFNVAPTIGATLLSVY